MCRSKSDAGIVCYLQNEAAGAGAAGATTRYLVESALLKLVPTYLVTESSDHHAFSFGCLTTAPAVYCFLRFVPADDASVQSHFT